VDFFDVSASRKWAPAVPLVTSRNNLHAPSRTVKTKAVFRRPRPYVEQCCKATLGLYYRDGRIAYRALACGSWSCPHCRRQLAARLLDRLRSGMESRSDGNRILATLTLDPSLFGGRVVGSKVWDDGRRTNLWAEPTLEQFDAAAAQMSREFRRLCNRVNAFLARRGLPRVRYFRVVELHRNTWPHYHVIFEHPTLDAEAFDRFLSGWPLGRTDARDVSVDDAVGEVAPYLVSSEKGAGHKAYQFAASALPKHFRLHTSSKGFLGPSSASEAIEKPEHHLVLRGHFTDHLRTVREWGGSAAFVCPPPAPSDRPHRPPSGALTFGDGAVVYYAELVTKQALHAPPDWFRELDRRLFRQGQGGAPAAKRGRTTLTAPSSAATD
jgi:hypothetical protein